MGASGKKLRGHGQPTNAASPPIQVKDGPYGRPPHPVYVRTGQIYWPRHARTRRQFRVSRVYSNGAVRARRIDRASDTVQLTVARLLAVGEDGIGEHYSFIGWLPGLYGTWACAVARERGRVLVIVPEWHPAWPVEISTRSLSPSVDVPGGWMRACADLSAAVPAHLTLSLSEACDDPGREVCPLPEWSPSRHHG